MLFYLQRLTVLGLVFLIKWGEVEGDLSHFFKNIV